MDIWEANKLVLFIAFVVPGFVSLKTCELLLPRAPRESSQQLIDAVAYSSINYAILLWPIFEMEAHNVRATHPSAYIAFYFVVLLSAPVSWACLIRKMRSTQFFLVFIVALDCYVHIVPFVEEPDYYFLKTVIPSRKATRDYLLRRKRDETS